MALGLAVGVGAVVGVVSLRGRQDSGEQADEEQAQRRHAGADDAHADLDRRPLGDADVVPSGVCAVAELDDGLESENADDGDTE